ncbi:MAG: UPF0104 family protein [Dehalococcoidia bacterium]|nr:MAG: UPF0104 family protein [Dehalococcoidia bacterium]
MALVGAMWALQGRVPPEIWQLLTGAAVLCALGLIGLLAIPGLERWLRHPGRIETTIPVSIWLFYQKMLDFGFNLIHGVRALGRSPLALILIVMQSLYIWLCDALLLYVVLMSIGATSSLSVSLFAGMVSDLVAAVPITPGALGQFDAALVGLLTLFNLSTSQGSLTVLLTRLVSLWTFIPIGAAVTYIFGFSRVFNLSGKVTGAGKITPSNPVPTLVEG